MGTMTAVEAADIPHELQTQRTIASLGLTINQYVKTLQGRQMIETQEHFVLGGRLYQGFGQRAVEPTEDQLSEAELEGAHDIDGSKHQLLASRTRRLEAARLAKNRELAQRRKVEISAERDALELELLKRKMALEPDEPAEPEIDPVTSTVPDIPKLHACTTCGKAFPAANKLHAHKMGAKH